MAVANLSKEFKKILHLVRPAESIRFYDLRGSTMTDLKDAHVESVFRRYVTDHSLNREILGTYESQSLHRHLEPYFNYIRPLLSAIAQRADELHINGPVAAMDSSAMGDELIKDQLNSCHWIQASLCTGLSG